ncbi:MAG TPA: tetratricopeptide repeat protein, partial [Gemmatimonadales bacterium]|nr:tetratricopeptide repeat protein [Gemmatimonadales bacterium]
MKSAQLGIRCRAHPSQLHGEGPGERSRAWLHRLTVLALLLGITTAAAAQAPFDKPPKRPHLDGKADTNSALAYYSYGIAELEGEPYQAATAFYWAARLDPTWAAPLYAQRTALLLSHPQTDLTFYLTRHRDALKSRDIQRIDSLAYRALVKNPFIDRRMDGMLITVWLGRETGHEVTLNNIGIGNPNILAWAAYLRGDYQNAAERLEKLIGHSPRSPGLRYWMALTRFAQGQLDSARDQLRQSVDFEREVEEDIPGVGWLSHASDEYAIGLLFGLTSQPDSARAAYERALSEDVRFHPAHYQLGKMRLLAHDTTGAIDECLQAVSLSPDDAGYLTDVGVLLIATGQVDSGATMLRRAVAAEPYYALPHYTLGLVYEQSGMRAEARGEFETFVALAPQNMTAGLSAAQRHLEGLKGAP